MPSRRPHRPGLPWLGVAAGLTVLLAPLTAAHAASATSVARRVPSGVVPAQRAPAAPEPASLYALAVEKLLARSDADAIYVLPSAAASDVSVRPRRASGAPRVATATTARRVVALLRERGIAGVRGTRPQLGRDDVLQIVLGELRFEPERSPTFARLRISVVGGGGARQSLDFLLKREGDVWRALNMEAADNIGMAPAPPSWRIPSGVLASTSAARQAAS